MLTAAIIFLPNRMRVRSSGRCAIFDGPRTRSAIRSDAWYRKPRPTFTDSLAAVRRQFWREQGLLLSWRQAEVRKLRPALCQAA